LRVSDMTVRKDEILAIVPEDKVQAIREYAKRTQNHYDNKIESTYQHFKEAMLNFPR